MKSTLFGLKTSLVVALAVAVFLPQMSTASTLSDKDSEIRSLRAQLKHCQMHKKAKKKKRVAYRRKRSRVIASRTRVMQTPVVIEKPVYIDRVVTKEVFVDRPVMIEKSIDTHAVVETGTVGEHVLVQHTKKKRKSLIHIGIPGISVGLF